MAIEIEAEAESPVNELDFEFGSKLVEAVGLDCGSGSPKQGRHEIQVRASGGSVSRRKIDGDLDYDPGFVVVVVAADTL
jgi:hypothetical protein